jgi:hypothetical protein
MPMSFGRGAFGGCRLVANVCVRVADHERSADRHAPEAPGIALAGRLRLFEEFLCAQLIDLRYRRRRKSH